VGYGKGFYDRFLKKCRSDSLKIGLSFFPGEEKIEDLSEADFQLTHCVTPDRIYEF
jgi:5-formyltetrahydrofolate cyclo-ligase